MSENNNMDEEIKDAQEKQNTQETQQAVKNGVATPLFVVVLLIAIIGVIISVCLLLAQRNEKKDKAKENTKSTEAVELGEYKGIEVSVVPTEDDIQEAIEMAMEDYVDYEQLEGTVADGDTVYASFKATMDGKEYEDGTGEEFVEIGSGDWIDGFEEGLIGVKTGETKTLNLKFPDDYEEDESVAGKDVTFEVKVEYIAGEEILPEYNDDFVKKASEGEAKTVAEYEEQLKKSLYEDNLESVGDTAWEEILENSTVNEYPDDMVQISIEVIRSGYEDMADMYGMTIEELMESWEVTEEDFDEMAREEVAEFLIAQEIAKRENITVDDSEYQEQLEEEYEYYSGYDSIEDFEKEMGDYERNMALYNKVIDWVGDNAVIVDKMEE